MRLKVPLLIRFHGSDTISCHLEKRKQKKWKILTTKGKRATSIYSLFYRLCGKSIKGII
jgi:hypothetical protein